MGSFDINKKILAEKLKHLRISSGLDIKECASKLNCSYTTYLAWETGIHLPRSTNLREIAVLHNVPLSYLTDNSITAEDETTKTTLKDSIPLLNPGMFYREQNLTEILKKCSYYNLNLEYNPETIFAFQVKGDAMTRHDGKTINDGQIAICTSDFTPQSIDHAVVCLNLKGDTGMIREIGFNNGQVVVKAWNENYEALTVPQTDLKVFGRVVRVIQDL